MKKIYLTLATTGLLLQNSEACARSLDIAEQMAVPSIAPHPALVAVSTLLGLACLARSWQARRSA